MKSCYYWSCIVCLRLHVMFRAGFTLSGAPVQKKMWSSSPPKNWRPFFSHHRPPLVRCQFWKKLTTFFAHYSRGLPIIWYFWHAKKSPLLLWGALFLWGPLFGRTCWTCLNPLLVMFGLSKSWSQVWRVGAEIWSSLTTREPCNPLQCQWPAWPMRSWPMTHRDPLALNFSSWKRSTTRVFTTNFWLNPACSEMSASPTCDTWVNWSQGPTI